MSNEAYTENLADFGSRERKEAARLLAAPLPDTFSDEGVRLAFNRSSGHVFLVNDEWQVAMMNGDDLCVFHNTPYSGIEGFIEDILEENTPDDLNREDVDYIRSAAEAEGIELPEAWAEG